MGRNLVTIDFQDLAVGIDFDLAFAAVGGAVEIIDLAAVVGIGVIRGHGEAGHAGLGSGEDVGWDAAGLRGAGAASAAGCAGGAGGTLLRGAACSAILRGSAGGEQGGGGDEEQGFQCFHGFGYMYLVLFWGRFYGNRTTFDNHIVGLFKRGLSTGFYHRGHNRKGWGAFEEEQPKVGPKGDRVGASESKRTEEVFQILAKQGLTTDCSDGHG